MNDNRTLVKSVTTSNYVKKYLERGMHRGLEYSFTDPELKKFYQDHKSEFFPLLYNEINKLLVLKKVDRREVVTEIEKEFLSDNYLEEKHYQFDPDSKGKGNCRCYKYVDPTINDIPPMLAYLEENERD